MRNVFDQYDTPENRLSHALAVTLHEDPELLDKFLDWVGISERRTKSAIRVTEQHMPGIFEDSLNESLRRGLPDIVIYDDHGWAVLVECKIQARLDWDQIERHSETAKKHGLETFRIIVVQVDEARASRRNDTTLLTWRDIYKWMGERLATSYWARQLVHYMQVFERRMLLQEYGIRGTITMFDGLRFDDENPYSYLEGRRLIRLLGDLLQQRPDLQIVGVNPSGKRRPAITGSKSHGVWDFLPLTAASESQQFTAFPHLTMVINRHHAVAAITIPNSTRGGFRSRLKSQGLAGFVNVLRVIEESTRPILERTTGAKPMIYLEQRHFGSQRSEGEVDARLSADLRTVSGNESSGVRRQPQWVEAVFHLLSEKRSNMQLGIEMQLSYKCPVVRSADAADLFADCWKALAPLLNLAIAR